MFLMKLKEPF